MSDAERFRVVFQPSGILIEDAGETPLLHLARRAGVRVESVCGARGVCRSCAIRISGEHVPPPSRADRESFTADQLSAGWRRACQTYAAGPCDVHVPAKTAGGLVSRGKEVDGGRVPIVDPVLAPTAEPRRWRRGGRDIGPITRGAPLGLAVDLGTTNIAATLVDMASGAVVASGTKVNPQVVFGADVISRLTHATKGYAHTRDMQQAAVDAVAELADDLTEGATGRIAEVAVVGNTVMQHLLLGLPIATLARAPYAPAEVNAVERPAADFGFGFTPGARLYAAPSVAGFVGGDHMAALIEVLADPPPGRWALLGIGTNTEIALFADGVVTSASCASGPALEGGRVTCGMRAGPGAVCIETMFSRLEAVQAIRAAKDNTALPVICTFAFEIGRKGFRTMDGVTPEQAAAEATAAGADVIGANCGCGIGAMIDIVKLMKAAAPDRPILVHANAGLPEIENGKTVYRETPDAMAARVPELIAAGAAIVGGCCGTTPDHIAAIARVVRGRH